MIATQDYSDVAVIAGANVPMLLDTLDYLESDYTLDDMVEELIAAGKDGVMYRHRLGCERSSTKTLARRGKAFSHR